MHENKGTNLQEKSHRFGKKNPQKFYEEGSRKLWEKLQMYKEKSHTFMRGKKITILKEFINLWEKKVKFETSQKF